MTVTITGIDQVNQILAAIAPREAKNLLSTTTLEMAKQLATDAKTYAPDDPRTPEWFGSSFGQKRERGNRNTVQASVIVKNIDRNFFWRFLEYGQGPDHVEHAMFLKALQKMRPQITTVYMRIFGQKLEARLKRLRK